MDGRNIWKLVKENQQPETSRQQSSSRSHHEINQQLLDVEAVADAAELQPAELSQILDEMVRQESEKKNKMSEIRRIGSKLFEKVKQRRSGSSKASSTHLEGKGAPPGEAASASATSSFRLPSSTTKPLDSERPFFTVGEPSSPFGSQVVPSIPESIAPAVQPVTPPPQTPSSPPLLPPPPPTTSRPTIGYRSSSRSSEQDAEEKCAYLFRGDSLYNKPADSGEKVERVHIYDPFCPVHGSRRRLITRRPKIRDLDYHLTSIESVDDTEPSGVILLSQAFAAKLIRKRRRALLSGPEKYRNDKAKRKILVNLWIVSLTFLFLFTAFHGLQNLQASINGRLGTDCLSIFYTSLSLSYLFVPSFILNRLGCKRTLIASSGIFMIYMLSNFLPKYYSLVPASILAGCAGSCLWAAKCVYILECGTKYAHLNIEAQNVVIIRFFGYFFMVLHLGQVIGNLISSLILTAAIGYHQPEDRVQKCCGHLFRENVSYLSEQAIENLRRPPQSAYLSVCGVYFCCTIVALMIVLLFLNSLTKDEIARLKAPFFSTDICKTIFRNLAQPKPLLLVPLTFFSGIEQAFVVGLYTKAYIGCGLGISQIGFVMTSFGVTDAICSLVFGPLMKLFGRMPLFAFGAVNNMLMIMTLLIWPLNPGDTSLFYAIAGVWGMADGVWNTQINGFWVALSAGSLETAFANYRFWESTGFAFGLFLTRFTDIAQFLLISLGMLLAGMLCYSGIEFYDDVYLYTKSMFESCKITRKRGTSTDKPIPSMETSLISATSAQVDSGKARENEIEML